MPSLCPRADEDARVGAPDLFEHGIGVPIAAGGFEWTFIADDERPIVAQQTDRAVLAEIEASEHGRDIVEADGAHRHAEEGAVRSTDAA